LEHPKTASIVLVDDDELALSSLRALFSLETDYLVTCFDDPVRACKELESTPVDVVVSDYLMPRMNGIDLLKEVRRVQPEAARILLTGFADKVNAIRAINEVGLYQYLEKPWDNQEMLIVIRNALKEKSLRRELAEKVKELDRLLWEHKELADRHSYLEREMEMAARVQQSLLPDRLPEIESFRINSLYRPCRWLGGDYYDFVVNQGRAIILVSDVSGHGTQAALTSMLLKASFQDAAAKAQEPSQLLARMNATLYRFLPTGMFAAATLLWLDLERLRIVLANAGLPYPFLLGHSRRKIDQIPLGGLPLGMFEGTGLESYDVREVQLAPGDVLLIATDGLGEIKNCREELFQDCQLRQALTELSGRSGTEVMEALLDRATRFSFSQPFADDVTMLAITKT
jgi:serine phosphatase RsbU (regulator of sigma subunit)